MPDGFLTEIGMMRGLTAFLFGICILMGCGQKSELAIVGNTDGMMLREKPSAKEAKVGYAPYNSSVKILGKDGPEETIYGVKARWYKVEYDGKKGWMFSGFLRLQDSTAVADAKPQKMQRPTREPESQDQRKIRSGQNGAKQSGNGYSLACYMADAQSCTYREGRYTPEQEMTFSSACSAKNGVVKPACPTNATFACVFPNTTEYLYITEFAGATAYSRSSKLDFIRIQCEQQNGTFHVR